MENQDKKQYSTPEIIFETDLEVKAGTPLGGIDSEIDLFPGIDEQFSPIFVPCGLALQMGPGYSLNPAQHC